MQDYRLEVSLLNALLAVNKVPEEEHADCRKWLRFYLDFCGKYGHSHASPASLAPFLRKLQSKGQSPEQRTQARRTINLYYRSLRAEAPALSGPVAPSSSGTVGVRREEPQDSSPASPA